MALIEVDDLSVVYASKQRGNNQAVRDVSFRIEPGEFVGLVGESGSGKSTLGNAILQLLERPGRITHGSVRFNDEDLTSMREGQLRGRRWRDFSTVFQSSMNSLNPVITIEAQFRDVMREHAGMSDVQIRHRTSELLRMVNIDPSFARFYPHELSGGMKQRVAIALALALSPQFVLLDEPTTGLDVVVQRLILQNLRALQERHGFAVLLISHDLGTVLEVCDRVMVMYGGEIVEEQSAGTLLERPIHPYTRALLGSYANPKSEDVAITYIPGRPPDLTNPPVGCPFTPRCPEAIERCSEVDPELLPMWNGKAACHVAEQWWNAETGKAPAPSHPRPSHDGSLYTVGDSAQDEISQYPEILRLEDVHKVFSRRRLFKTSTVNAVNGVSFDLKRGWVTGLVGESGSGKSTIGRMITGVERPTGGSIRFGDVQVERLHGRALREYRKHVQLVFQDPFSALNPAHTVLHSIMRPLVNYLKLDKRTARLHALELLERVGLTPPEQIASRRPHQLSGGQQQRVVVARALAPEPDLIVADEPVSMLDVSIRAEILQLLDNLLHQSQIGLLYITHDLLSARLLADDIFVLHEGKVVEHGPARDVIANPQDEYTKLLLESIPNPYEEIGK